MLARASDGWRRRGRAIRRAPRPARAGLREGGNAVDAAVAAVLASFAVESPLTGFGAGGYMTVHTGGETTVLDFFVAAPGLDGTPRGEELARVDVVFDAETVQAFYVGPVACGVPGTPAGLVEALRRWGSVPLPELADAAIRLARDGSRVNHEQAYIMRHPRADPRPAAGDARALCTGRTDAARRGDFPLR